MDLSKALAPKSDQLDYADLEGHPPRVFTIADVHENGAELADQQPVNIRLEEFPRVWRPSKGMLRVLADNLGKDTKQWPGTKVELYGDPDVYFGKEKVGGIRISRLSRIPKANTTRINPRGGRNATWTVKPLPDEPAPKSRPIAAPPNAQAPFWQHLKDAGIPTRDQALAFCSHALSREVADFGEVSDQDAADMEANFDALLADFMAGGA